jgi:hypothetical protein
MLLAHAVLLIGLEVMLFLDLCVMLVLLVVEVLLAFLFLVGQLLFLLLHVLHELVLLLKPLLEATLRQLCPLSHDFVVVVLVEADLFIHDLSEVLVTALEALVDCFGNKLASVNLLLKLFLLELHDLITLNLIVGLPFKQVFFPFLLELVPALLEGLLLLFQLLEALSHLVGGLPLQVHLDLLDLLVSHLLVVLHSLRLHLVEELFGHLDGFLSFLTKVLIHNPPVEVVEDFELDSRELLHGKTLCFLLLQVNQVHYFTIGVRDRGQERETPSCGTVELGTSTVDW